MEKTYKVSELLHPIVKLVIGIIALIFIKILAAIATPSFDESAPVILRHLNTAINLSINTLILLILLNFSREGRDVMSKVSEDKFFGDIVFYTVTIIAIGFAHWVYMPLFSILLQRYIYIYSLIFLVISVAMIIMLGIKVYKNWDKTTGLLIEKIKNIPDIIRRLEKQDTKKEDSDQPL